MRTGPWYAGTTYHRVLGPNQEGSIDTLLAVAIPWVVKGPSGRTGSPRPRAIPPNPRVSTSAPADVGYVVPGGTIGNCSGRARAGGRAPGGPVWVAQVDERRSQTAE